MSQASSPDCYTATLNSNPDVAGIGVIVGFAGTGLITVILLVIFYLFAHDPYIDHFQDRKNIQQQRKKFKPQPVDKLALGPLRKKWRMRNGATVLPKCILAMADIQIVTGIGILTSGFASLGQGIQLYHWQLIVYLAWFSAITHLAALSFIRRELRGWQANRIARMTLMFSLVVMLVIALIPTASFDLEDRDSALTHAVCSLTHVDSDLLTFSSMILSAVVILFSFMTRLIRSFRSIDEIALSLRDLLSRFSRKQLRAAYQWASIHHHGRSKFIASLAYNLVCQPGLALLILMRATLDIYASMLWEIVWLIYATVWGILHLMTTWMSNDDTGAEIWSFGQVIAVFLLLAPLINLGELSWPADEERSSQDPGVIGLYSQINSQSGAPQIVPTKRIDILDDDTYHFAWFKGLLVLLFIFTLEACTCFLIYVWSADATAAELLFGVGISWVFGTSIAGFIFALFSIVSHQLRGSFWRFLSHWAISALLILGLTATTVMCTLQGPWGPIRAPAMSLYGLLAMYVLGSLIVAFCHLFK